MSMKIGKLFLGASLALSLGGFAMPAVASIAPLQTPANSGYIGKEAPVLVQYADEADHLTYKAEGKVNEAGDEALAAKNAVKARHREHEANEVYHHSLGEKAESKMDEIGDSARDAKNAVKAEHRAHEAAEGER
jgi:hypothetical protein